MIDRVHEHIVSEPQQGARTDTILVIVAFLLNLLMLGISSGITRDSEENGTTTAVFGLFIALTATLELGAPQAELASHARHTVARRRTAPTA